MIPVPPLVAAKLALYSAMRERGMSEAELARRLGVTEKVVQSMLHLKRRIYIGQLERALAELGVQLEVTVRRRCLDRARALTVHSLDGRPGRSPVSG